MDSGLIELIAVLVGLYFLLTPIRKIFSKDDKDKERERERRRW